MLELEEIRLRFRRVIARSVYPSVIPTAENFSRLDISQPQGHQWIVAANLIDSPKLPEARRDRFGSSDERCFSGATVGETAVFGFGRNFLERFLTTATPLIDAVTRTRARA